MKMQEIRTIAKKLRINSFGKSKRDLVREIQLKEGNFDCYERSDGFCDQTQCLFRASCLSEKNT